MEYITVTEIIEIHDEIIKKYGGTGGVRDEGTLQLLVYKLSRERNYFRRAALALHMIAVDHPFFDGNKRTAFATAENELGDGGYYLNADAEEVIDLMRNIAEYKCTIKAVEKRIKELAKSHIG
ncbi:MAG: type II toxin-antitoxin system death-on-curing family toxin [Candidatus Methanoperedens sp.]|nr:type II toxin-antitoxin system death-on-curing family toxin [Candidatus Methanoperedens sp.]MCZ7404006.1 type II toxin-antitoxin system death-on-curing family toxin [Candidatus Methanoperedens sp.]